MEQLMKDDLLQHPWKRMHQYRTTKRIQRIDSSWIRNLSCFAAVIFAIIMTTASSYCMLPTILLFHSTEAFLWSYHRPTTCIYRRCSADISTIPPFPSNNNPNWQPKTSSSWVMLFMGKGDGRKKRNKKKSTSSDSKNVAPAGSAATPRVSNNINIPIRRQIELANVKKMYRQQQQSTKQVQRTKFRRQVNETELNALLEYRKNNRDPDEDVMSNMTMNKAPPLLLVDAYNIIFKWERLKKHAKTGNLDYARELLISDLEVLQSWKEWDIECVFDGGGRDPSLGTKTTASTSYCGIQIVFTGVGLETADVYVEQMCRTVSETGTMVIVATDDAMIRLAVQTSRNSNAFHMSADRLIEEITAAHGVIAYKVDAVIAEINGQGIRPKSLRPDTYLQNRGSIIVKDKRFKGKRRFTTLQAYQAAMKEEEEKVNDQLNAEAKLPNRTRSS